MKVRIIPYWFYICGFNMTIIAGLFVVVFGRVSGRWKGALAALLGIAVYALLVGASPPVVRAALMGGLALFARQIGRRQKGLNSLALVAALMAVFNPLVLWDVGFQLSFAASLGLVLYAEPMTHAFQGLIASRWSLSSVSPARSASISCSPWLPAQAMTQPVMLCHFQRLSLTALVANPLVLPVQPAVMILSGLAVLFGMVWLPLGQLVAYLAWPFAAQRVRNVASAVTHSLALAGLGALTILVWQQALAAPDGRLT